MDCTKVVSSIVEDFNRGYRRGYEEGYEQAKKDTVVHAHWEHTYYFESTIFGDAEYFSCSNCHNDTLCGIVDDYCSHCGAKMEDVIEE